MVDSVLPFVDRGWAYGQIYRRNALCRRLMDKTLSYSRACMRKKDLTRCVHHKVSSALHGTLPPLWHQTALRQVSQVNGSNAWQEANEREVFGAIDVRRCPSTIREIGDIWYKSRSREANLKPHNWVEKCALGRHAPSFIVWERVAKPKTGVAQRMHRDRRVQRNSKIF